MLKSQSKYHMMHLITILHVLYTDYIHQPLREYTETYSNLTCHYCGATELTLFNLFQHAIIGSRTCLKYSPYTTG